MSITKNQTPAQLKLRRDKQLAVRIAAIKKKQQREK